MVGVSLFCCAVFGLLFNGYVKSSCVVMILGIVIALCVVGDGDSASEISLVSLLKTSLYVLLIVVPVLMVYYYLKDRPERKKEKYRTEQEVFSLTSDIERAEKKLSLLKSDNWLNYFKSNTGILTITENEYGRKKERDIAIKNTEFEIASLTSRLRKINEQGGNNV